MPKDAKPSKRRAGISPELESVFNSALAYTIDTAQPQFTNQVPDVPPMARPNMKPDAVDRESQLTELVRAASYQPGAMADRLGGGAPDIEQAIVRPEEADRSVLNEILAKNITPEAIARMNARGTSLPQTQGISRTRYPGASMAALAQAANDPDAAYITDDERYLVSNPPLSSLANDLDRRTFVISKYPTLALGLASGTYSEKEVRETTNFAVAFQSAAFLAQPDVTQEQARAYLSYMSPAQQLLVLDIIKAGVEESAQQAQSGTLRMSEQEKQAQIQAASDSAYESFTPSVPELEGAAAPLRYFGSSIAERVARQQVIGEEDTGNTVANAAKSVWNWSAGWAFDMWNDLIDTTNVWWRAAAIGADKLGGDQFNAAFGTNLGFANYETSWEDVWNMAQNGGMDQRVVQDIRDKYGVRKTNVALRLLNGQSEQDPDVLPQIILELSPLALAGDQEAADLLEWLGAAGYGNDEDHQEAMKIFDELQLGRTGDTGNVFFRSIVGDVPESERLQVGQSDTYRNLATAGSVYGMMLDPLWFAGPIRTGMMSSRYGIWKLMGEAGAQRSDEFARMFGQKNVRNAFTSLGESLRRIDDAENLGAAGQLRKSVEAQWKRYFTPQALDEMRGFMRSLPEEGAVQPYSVRAFQDFFEANENLSHIIVGQSARRTRQIVVPHMTAATVMVKRMGMAARGMTYQSGQGAEYIDNVVGEGWTRTMPPEAADTLARTLENAESFDDVVQVLSDFRWTDDGVMERSFLGSVVAKPGVFDEARYGFKTKGGLLSRRGFERARKPFQRMPMNDEPIFVSDGSQASRVGDLLEWSGIPRYFARAVEEVWASPATSEAQRMAMIPGLERLAMRAKGVDEFDVGRADFYSRVAGATRGDIYSPLDSNLTATVPRIRASVRQEIDDAVESERLARLTELGRTAYQVGDEVWVWKPKAGGGEWVSGPVVEVRRTGNLVVKGFGSKPIKPNKAVLRSGDAGTFTPDIRQWPAPQIDADARRIAAERVRAARSEATLRSASEYAPGVHGAVVMPDATQHAWFPSIPAMDRYSRRASVLTALLGNNPIMGGVTDAWVLGTLAGPRFQIRSGFEDIGMYAYTGGELGAIATGRAMSQATLKGSMRTKNVHSNTLAKSGQTARPVIDEQGRITDFITREADRPEKLGVLATGWRSLVNGMTGKGFTSASRRRARLDDMSYDSILDTMNQVLVTQATPNELRLANEAALAGDRQVLASLVASLYVRQRMAGHPVFGWVSRLGGRDTSTLSEAQQSVVRWLYEGVYYGDLLRGNDEASELGAHLFDGAPVSSAFEIEVGTIRWNPDQKQWERVIRERNDYVSIPMTGDENQLRSWWNMLAKAMPIADGPKGYAALVRLSSYVRALQSGDAVTQERLISEVAEVIEGSRGSTRWDYFSRLKIADATGANGLAKATLENLRVLLTTRSGDLNWDIYNRLKRTVVDPATGEERTEWGIRYIDPETNKIVYTVDVSDLRQLPMAKMPAQIVINRGREVAVSAGQSWSQMMWGGMGRSLARLTRSPIFMGQYVKSREVLAPLQQRRYERLVSEGMDQAQAYDSAAEWAVQTATERAYQTTVAYVDNPAIRTQLAWEVRNVSRFYRALEDFGRRMIRTARNEPSFYLKLAASWRIIDSSGWFWEDEYGDKYFIWPGTHTAFQALNWFMNNVVDRGGMYTSALPMAYSSNVTNLTPSADPNAVFPTFSGQYATLAVLPIVRTFPSLFGIDVEKELFGEYSQGTSIWTAALPPHLMRAASLLPTFGSTSDSSIEDRLDISAASSPLNGLYVASAISAIQAAGAAGWWNENQFMSATERADLQRRVDRVAQWMVGMKIVASYWLPAAVSIEQLDSSQLARDLGYDDLRSEFIAILKQADSMDEAVVAWMQMYPDGRSPFVATISRSEADPNRGYWAPYNEVATFAEENKAILDENPRGLSYFQPADGTTTLRAFEILKVNDLAPKGSPLTYLERVLTAQSDAIMEQNQRLYLMDKLAGRSSQTVWSETRNRLINGYDGNPGWPNTGSKTVVIPSSAKPLRGGEDYETLPVPLMRKAGEALRNAGNLDARGERLMELIAINEYIYGNLYPQNRLDKQFEQYKEYVRDQWNVELFRAVSEFPNDNVMLSALREMTLHIGFAWPTELEVANG